ncbi:uncharacterized protein LOC111455429 isoform X1 [Cucurbita moschata]|uniref:Uncharacterized protein LOC111455429 isoform X1 n=1 Tax=Cucurbita moschata TaxID=3662 RepID=A0A6J1GMY3_CUCMO|nr:uncharacterized protein LOC111455429 isoform X1 [Cucurbita moschata]
MASDMNNSEADHLVELIVRDESPSIPDVVSILEEDAPLLTQIEKPKINIFTISYPRRKPLDQVKKIHDSEVSSLTQSIIWIWGGSRYSGLLCASLSSIFYFTMEILMGFFSAQPIPILEMTFTRCTIITLLSYLWLRRSEQPIFGLTHVRKLLISRALAGLLSMMSFIYSIQRLPSSQAVVISFTTPLLASVVARIILQEKLKISDFGGLACSFFGVLLIFQDLFTSPGTEAGLTNAGKGSIKPPLRSHHAYAVLIGFAGSIAGGISHCLIRASAKASDQPVATVFSFGMLACPVTAMCAMFFEDLVMPSLYSIFMMLVLGLLAFLAEVCWARGLQLEKTSKVANLRYMEASLVQLWHIGVLGVAPFGPIVGVLIILISTCWTLYVGPDRDTE